MFSIKNFRFMVFGFIITGFLSIYADEMGRSIMEKNNALKKPSTVMNNSVMVIFRGGAKELKEFNVFSKRYGKEMRSRLLFTKPVKLDFISWSEPGKNTRQWMNLTGKFQEIASSDRRMEFMGSHFYFEDLAEQHFEDFDYTYVGEAEVNGVPCYEVESKKKKGPEVYTKTLLYVRKSDYFVIQIDFFEKRGHTKTLTLDQIEVINGITLARKITMRRTGGKDKSIVYLQNNVFNQAVSDTIFQP